MYECLASNDLELLGFAETGRATGGENDASNIVRMTGHWLILIADRKWRSTC